jgi:hypothetical protein
METAALRIIIRQKLQDGRLPYDGMPRFWGGLADGEMCDACDALIGKEQLVMEGIASTFSNKKAIQLHVRCFHIWDHERRVPMA